MRQATIVAVVSMAIVLGTHSPASVIAIAMIVGTVVVILMILVHKVSPKS